MARFVTMHILAYQTGNINKVTIDLRFHRKYRVECSNKLLFTTEQLHHPVYIMRHKEAILPGSSFGISTTYFNGIERSLPIAIHPFGAEEFRRTVEYIDIVLRTFDVLLVNILFSHRLCHTCNAPIIVSEFQQARYGFLFNIRRDKSIFYIVIRSLFILFRRNDHSIQCFLRIEAPDTFQISIGNNRNRVVSDHCTRLSGRKRPDRKFARSIINIQVGINHIVYQCGVNQRHQGIPCAESIPNGESGILLFTFWRLPYLHIMPTILTVDVAHNIGHNHSVIHSGIEVLQVIRIAPFYCNGRKCLFPSGTGGSTHGIKIKVRYFSFQIFTRILLTDY